MMNFARIGFIGIALMFLGSCARQGLNESLERTLGIKLEGVREPKPFFFPRWAKNLDPVYQSGNLPIALNGPLIHDDLVFVGSGDGSMNAFSVEQGRKVWSFQDGAKQYSRPLIYKDLVIYGNIAGRLIARNFLSGEKKFEIDLEGPIESELTIAEGRILLQTRNHRLISLDAETGKILWAYTRSIPNLTTLQGAGRPVVRDQKIYIGFADGHMVCFQLEDGNLIWETKVQVGSKFVDVDSTPLFWKGNLYVSSLAGELVVLNPLNGAVIYKFQEAVAHRPVVIDDRLVFGTMGGAVMAYSESFNLLRRVSAIGPVNRAVIWKNALVVGTTDGKLQAFSRDLGEELGTYSFGHAYSTVFNELAVNGDSMSVLSSRNRLYQF